MDFASIHVGAAGVPRGVDEELARRNALAHVLPDLGYDASQPVRLVIVSAIGAMCEGTSTRWLAPLGKEPLPLGGH